MRWNQVILPPGRSYVRLSPHIEAVLFQFSRKPQFLTHTARTGM